MSAKGYKNNFRKRNQLNRRHFSNAESYATKHKRYVSGNWTAEMERRRYDAEYGHIQAVAKTAVARTNILVTLINALRFSAVRARYDDFVLYYNQKVWHGLEEHTK